MRDLGACGPVRSLLSLLVSGEWLKEEASRMHRATVGHAGKALQALTHCRGESHLHPNFGPGEGGRAIREDAGTLRTTQQQTILCSEPMTKSPAAQDSQTHHCYQGADINSAIINQQRG